MYVRICMYVSITYMHAGMRAGRDADPSCVVVAAAAVALPNAPYRPVWGTGLPLLGARICGSILSHTWWVVCTWLQCSLCVGTGRSWVVGGGVEVGLMTQTCPGYC